jgi:ribosome biogenesis protein Nip4
LRELKDFLEAIGAVYEPMGEKVNLNDRRFIVNSEVAGQIHDRGRMIYAGRLLGRVKKEFIPSASLLRELSKMEGLNKMWVEKRVGWLFVCGRDIFEESIMRAEGVLEEGGYFLVMMGEDCLGYGEVETRKGKKLLRNIFDLGDFLRRETKHRTVL